jgi:hypothetical protein
MDPTTLRTLLTMEPTESMEIAGAMALALNEGKPVARQVTAVFRAYIEAMIADVDGRNISLDDHPDPAP